MQEEETLCIMETKIILTLVPSTLRSIEQNDGFSDISSIVSEELSANALHPI